MPETTKNSLDIDRQKEFSGYEPVRSGFELDLSALQQYMQKHVEGFKGTLTINQFKGGQSNPTYLLTAGDKQYVLRRKPSGHLLKSAHAVDREYTVITALGKTDFPVAKTYCLCKDESVIGSWFYIMDYVAGRIFWSYQNIPLAERLDVYDAIANTAAKLHLVDYEAIGLGDYGKAGNYFARQISRWTKQYRASVDSPYPAMEAVIEWLNAHIPENDETTIVHGDFRVDNIIFHPTEPKVIALLDWELSTLGHPLVDISNFCLRWKIPPGHLDGWAGVDCRQFNIPTLDEFIAAYCRRTGREGIAELNYYIVFCLFRIAGICFGIKGRLRDGTAASAQAIISAAKAEPLIEIGLSIINDIS